MAILSDTSSVIDALGGTIAVATIFGWDKRRVSNWRAYGVFPPESFETLRQAMSERGISAPLSLWRQIPTDQLTRMALALEGPEHEGRSVGPILVPHVLTTESFACSASRAEAKRPSQRRSRRRRAA